MNTREMFTELRKASPRLPEFTGREEPENVKVLRIKHNLRPAMLEILQAMAHQIHSWRNADANGCGLRKGAGNLLQSSDISKLFLHGPYRFCYGIATAMLNTMLSAIKKHSSELKSPLNAIMIGHGLSDWRQYFVSEFEPGLLVINGLSYVAIQLQSAPSVDRTLRLVRNTVPLVVDWANQSVAFTGIRIATLCVDANWNEYQRSSTGLISPRAMSIVNPETENESLDFRQELLPQIRAHALTLIAEYSPLRMGCAGLSVKGGDVETGPDFVTYSVEWALKILSSYWKRIDLNTQEDIRHAL
jgi:hypothetical protein